MRQNYLGNHNYWDTLADRRMGVLAIRRKISRHLVGLHKIMACFVARDVRVRGISRPPFFRACTLTEETPPPPLPMRYDGTTFHQRPPQHIILPKLTADVTLVRLTITVENAQHTCRAACKAKYQPQNRPNSPLTCFKQFHNKSTTTTARTT